MFKKLQKEILRIKERTKPISNRKLQRKLTQIENILTSLKADEIRKNESKIFYFNNHFDRFDGFCSYPNAPEIIMYLPNALNDFIQSEIIKRNDFFSANVIKKADLYLKDGANILDIGANIGNNSLYWALVRKAKKIYSFEPILSSYEILLKNIQLNTLDTIIKPFNFALGKNKSKASIHTTSFHNIGVTSLKDDENGDLEVRSLDNLLSEGFFKERIDFIKIDVEGFENKVLLGGGGIYETA
ncbi:MULTISPECIES: FkbM family methyltransferase [unclassified Campylobacter]|uniref:FkbM family methyltransferase n=1 Tax=unclassified Campylobacter TaxID=2593542 RepID=UPI00224AC33B|nr:MULTISPECIES: FkbM family methyltransferase [unclassified Campylobacter]MCX2683695.1 FkbM family methyltransferase [Campylobacter sp. MIT 21-1684]MCX2751980.1 FkbM family methyltransferase [Campylobacter sp. MIT 21-1682]